MADGRLRTSSKPCPQIVQFEVLSHSTYSLNPPVTWSTFVTQTFLSPPPQSTRLQQKRLPINIQQTPLFSKPKIDHPPMADTSAPAFIKRSKHRTARAREPSPSEDAPNTTTDASPSTLAAKIKKQHKERVKPKARLSFGGDEEVSPCSPRLSIL